MTHPDKENPETWTDDDDWSPVDPEEYLPEDWADEEVTR